MHQFGVSDLDQSEDPHPHIHGRFDSSRAKRLSDGKMIGVGIRGPPARTVQRLQKENPKGDGDKVVTFLSGLYSSSIRPKTKPNSGYLAYNTDINSRHLVGRRHLASRVPERVVVIHAQTKCVGADKVVQRTRAVFLVLYRCFAEREG